MFIKLQAEAGGGSGGGNSGSARRAAHAGAATLLFCTCFALVLYCFHCCFVVCFQTDLAEQKLDALTSDREERVNAAIDDTRANMEALQLVG